MALHDVLFVAGVLLGLSGHYLVGLVICSASGIVSGFWEREVHDQAIREWEDSFEEK